MLLSKIYADIDLYYGEMVDIRRYLHQYPELSCQEEETAKYIAGFYENLNLPYQTNIGGHGVIATLEGGVPGKTVALRADFDALPITEENDVPYKSRNEGVMHACGHDGHTATLLILAKVLQKHQAQIPGTVVFVHQPSEELFPGGAKPMINSRKLDHVDAVFGNHLWATTEFRTIETNKDTFMAGSDSFKILIKGEGGHGGYPHETKDALIVGAEIVTKLQTIISRKLDPLHTAVVTVGRLESGTALNVIADDAKIEGSVRYFDKDDQQLVKRELERIVKGICAANDVAYEIAYHEGYPPVVNHIEEAEMVMAIGKQLEDVEHVREVPPQLGAEDFAYYLQAKPGAFFFTGAKPDGGGFPHHHPKFDINEKAMPIAAKMLAGAYLNY